MNISRIDCPACRGDGTQTVVNFFGRRQGLRPCSICRGTGALLLEDRACPACNGSKALPLHDLSGQQIGTMSCALCRGSGLRPGVKRYEAFPGDDDDVEPVGQDVVHSDDLDDLLDGAGALRLDGFDDCIVAVGRQGGSSQQLLVYDRSKILDQLMQRDGMGYSEAVEHFEFNIIGGYLGEGTPFFLEWAVETAD